MLTAEPKTQSIWIYGSGAVGSYYGARLLAAGNKVIFIARGENLHAMRNEGLKVLSPKGSLNFETVCAISEDDLCEAAEPKFVLVCTKRSSNVKVAVRLHSLLSESSTPIFIVQNGLHSTLAFTELFPQERIVRCIVYIASRMAQPGIVEHSAGELFSMPKESYAAQQLADLLNRAGVEVKLSPDFVANEVWPKLIWNSAFNTITAVTGCTTQPILNDPAGIKLLYAIGREVINIAQACGIPLTQDHIEAQILRTKEQLGDISTSTREDKLVGKTLEIAAITGDLLYEAAKRNLEVPHLQTLDTLLRLGELQFASNR